MHTRPRGSNPHEHRIGTELPLAAAEMELRPVDVAKAEQGPLLCAWDVPCLSPLRVF